MQKLIDAADIMQTEGYCYLIQWKGSRRKKREQSGSGHEWYCISKVGDYIEWVDSYLQWKASKGINAMADRNQPKSNTLSED